MNCKCGIKAFFFEKTTHEGTFNVFKCDTQETKKTSSTRTRRDTNIMVQGNACGKTTKDYSTYLITHY